MAVRTKRQRIPTLVAIGDSLTVGNAVDPVTYPPDGILPEHYKWLWKLWNHLNSADPGWQYYNRGVGAQDTTQLYREIADGGVAAGKPIWRKLFPTLVILAAGTNNSKDEAGEAAWLADTISAVQYLNGTMIVPLNRICILTLPPHTESHVGGTNEVNWLHLNATIRTTVAALGCVLFEMETAYDAEGIYNPVTDPDNLFSNGALHVNADGADKWYIAMRDQLPAGVMP